MAGVRAKRHTIWVSPPVPFTVMQWVKDLRRELKARGDPKRAEQMRAYMKSALPYYGVPLPEARKVFRQLGKKLAFSDAGLFEATVRYVFTEAKRREERYAALALLALPANRKFQTIDALPLYEALIVEGAWWDLVDEVATHFLLPLLRSDRVAIEKTLRAWAASDDLWLRRSAIIAQVLAHEETDLKLLFSVIEPAIEEKEFFLRKAIGWALRAAGKEFPKEVRAFVEKHRARLSGLSIREAEKSL